MARRLFHHNSFDVGTFASTIYISFINSAGREYFSSLHLCVDRIAQKVFKEFPRNLVTTVMRENVSIWGLIQGIKYSIEASSINTGVETTRSHLAD